MKKLCHVGFPVDAIAFLAAMSAAFGLCAAVPERMDPRTRTFLPPTRIVWTSGDAVYGNRSAVKDAESLLKPRYGQIPEERANGTATPETWHGSGSVEITSGPPSRTSSKTRVAKRRR